jgi:GNAT superfamily N-acetyltransferase
LLSTEADSKVFSMAKKKQISTDGSSAPKSVKIRRAKPSDAARLAELSGQLGYPTIRGEMVRRMRNLQPALQHAVVVAESPEGKVIGWVHVSVSPLLEVDLRAEVNALVVADDARSRGAGALLLRAAEEWARKRGCKNMSVRSNVVRERAHEFYLRNGYEHYKTQKAFRKLIS